MKPVAAVVLLLIAAGMLLYAPLSHRWWHHEEGDDSTALGLRGVEICRGDCETKSYASYDPSGRSESLTGFVWSGRVAFTTDLAAVAAIALTLIATVRGRPRWIDRGLVRGTAVVGALAALVFVKTAPGSLTTLSMGAPIYLNVIGAVLACFGEIFASDVAEDIRARTEFAPRRPS